MDGGKRLPWDDWLSGRNSATAVAAYPYVCVRGDTIGADFAQSLTFRLAWALMELAELRVVAPETMVRLDPNSKADERWLIEVTAPKYLLYCEVEQQGDTLLLSHLIREVETDTLTPLDLVELPIDRLRDIPRDVIPEIIRHVVPEIYDMVIERARNRAPEDMEAQDCLITALLAIQRLTRESLATAEASLHKALSIDPKYATALAWLARVHSLRVGQGWTDNAEQTGREALDLAQRAIELDPNNAIALAIAGHMQSYLFGDFDTAMALFNQAAASGPNEAQGWLMSSVTFAYRGFPEEGLKRAMFGIRLTPRDRLSFLHFTFASTCAYCAGQYEEALKLARSAMAENQSYSATIRQLALAHAALGELEDARKFGSLLLEVQPEYEREYDRLIRFADPEVRSRCIQHLRLAGVVPAGGNAA